MPGTSYPKFAVSVLPVEQGRLGLPDLVAHSTIMLAKKGWLLFRHLAHHRAAALSPAALERPPGYHQLPDSCCLAATLPYRLRSMTQAFRHSFFCQGNRSLLEGKTPPGLGTGTGQRPGQRQRRT